MLKNLFSGNLVSVLLVILIAIQGINLYYTAKPPATPVIKGLTVEEEKVLKENQALIDKVKKLTDIKDDEVQTAVIATITDADGLRAAHPIQAEVYKDAKTGERVIGLADRMIIYDESENKIIYEGKSPAQIQQEQYLAELQPIMSQLSKLTTIDPNARPTLATVTDPEKLRAAQPELYKDAEINDKVLVFTDRVIIYRPSTNKIIFDGKIKVNSTTTK